MSAALAQGPRIVVICTEGPLARAVERACREPVTVAAEWSKLDSRVAWEACAVIFVCTNLDDAAVDRLQALGPASRRLPVLLTTARDYNNAKKLTAVIVQELVWLEDIDTTLAATVGRLTAGSRLAERFGQIVAAHPVCRGDPHLRDALLAACHGRGSALSATALAKAACCSPRHLQRKLRIVFPAEDRPAAFLLSCILLLKAHELAQREMAPMHIAAMLGVSDKTLDRLSRRLGGDTWAHVRRWPAMHLFRCVADSVERQVDSTGAGPKMSERRPNAAFPDAEVMAYRSVRPPW